MVKTNCHEGSRGGHDIFAVIVFFFFHKKVEQHPLGKNWGCMTIISNHVRQEPPPHSCANYLYNIEGNLELIFFFIHAQFPLSGRHKLFHLTMLTNWNAWI